MLFNLLHIVAHSEQNANYKNLMVVVCIIKELQVNKKLYSTMKMHQLFLKFYTVCSSCSSAFFAC